MPSPQLPQAQPPSPPVHLPEGIYGYSSLGSPVSLPAFPVFPVSSGWMHSHRPSQDVLLIMYMFGTVRR